MGFTDAIGVIGASGWIGAITSFFAMSNRLVHLAGTPPNEAFYLLGRVPK